MLLALAAAQQPSIEFAIPERYQKGATVKVRMVDTQEEINVLCGDPGDGKITYGCATDKNEIVVKNPCHRKSERRDKRSFANLMCHELGHINGWRHPYD
jgi:hypothetical protein